MALKSSRDESNSIPIVVIEGKLSDSDLKEFGEVLYGPFKEGAECAIIDLQAATEIGFVLLSAVYKINDELTAKDHEFVVVRKQGELKKEPPWGATYKFPLVVKNSREEAIAFLVGKVEKPKEEVAKPPRQPEPEPEAGKELEKEPVKEKTKEEKQEKKKEVAKPPRLDEMGAVAVFGGGKVSKPKPAKVVPLGKGGAVAKGSRLEQLDLVTIFSRTFSLYGRNALPVLCTSAVTHLPMFFVIIAMIAMLFMAPRSIIVFPFIIVPMQLFVWGFFEAGIARVVANDKLDIDSTTSLILGHAWNRVGNVISATLARYISFVAFMFLAFLASVVSTMVFGKGVLSVIILIVIMAFAIWFLLATFFTSDVASVENKGGFDAINRSMEIIRGYYLHTIALVIVLGLITGISSKALEMGVKFTLTTLMPLFRGSKYAYMLFMAASVLISVGTSLMTSLLASPVMFIGKTLLYFCSRVDTEGLTSGTLSKQLSE